MNRIKTVIASLVLFAALSGVAAAQGSTAKAPTPVKAVVTKQSAKHVAAAKAPKAMASAQAAPAKAPKAPEAKKHHGHKHMAKSPRPARAATATPKPATDAPKAKAAIAHAPKHPAKSVGKTSPVKKIGKHEQHK